MIGINTMMDSHESEFWLDPKIVFRGLPVLILVGFLRGEVVQGRVSLVFLMVFYNSISFPKVPCPQTLGFPFLPSLVYTPLRKPIKFGTGPILCTKKLSGV